MLTPPKLVPGGRDRLKDTACGDNQEPTLSCPSGSFWLVAALITDSVPLVYISRRWNGWVGTFKISPVANPILELRYGQNF